MCLAYIENVQHRKLFIRDWHRKRLFWHFYEGYHIENIMTLGDDFLNLCQV